MPRSFDYQVAVRKPVDEQLKMGRFELSDAEREAIITFILGLTDETPSPAQEIRLIRARSGRRGQAITEGRKVLEKYACGECHTLGLERWTIGRKTELRACRGSRLSGALAQEEDDDGKPALFFTLWEPATIEGRRMPGGRGRRGRAQGPVDRGPAAVGRHPGPLALSGRAR